MNYIQTRQRLLRFRRNLHFFQLFYFLPRQRLLLFVLLTHQKLLAFQYNLRFLHWTLHFHRNIVLILKHHSTLHHHLLRSALQTMMFQQTELSLFQFLFHNIYFFYNTRHAHHLTLHLLLRFVHPGSCFQML